MKKLRIAFLSCGSFIHIRPYIEYFKNNGHTVFWVTYDRPLWDLGVETFDISCGADARENKTKWRYLLAVPLLRRLLKRINIDVLHGHYITSAGLLCRWSGFHPYVLTAHGTDMISSIDSSVKRFLLKRIVENCSLVNVVSADLGDMARHCQVTEEKLLLVTLGVDTDRFLYRPADMHSPLRLICTRTLGSVYDPWTIIEACSILRSRSVNFTLTFAAGGPLQGALYRRCVQQGLDSIVKFLGGYNNSQVPSLLHDHDVNISASKSDGTSISLLEAMACGTFPIVSRIPANTAWIEDGKTGYLFGVGKADELANRVMQASSDKDFVRKALWENRRCVEERGCRKKNMEKLEEAITNVVWGAAKRVAARKVYGRSQ